jgi:hypothetical protein
MRKYVLMSKRYACTLYAVLCAVQQADADEEDEQPIDLASAMKAADEAAAARANTTATDSDDNDDDEQQQQDEQDEEDVTAQYELVVSHL